MSEGTTSIRAANFEADFRVPAYGGGCISNLMPAIFGALARNCGGNGFPNTTRIAQGLSRNGITPVPIDASWVPREFDEADRVILLVLDGLGYHQLTSRLHNLANFRAMSLRQIDSVAPTTTAAALTSITTGLAPASHGLVGYRMRIGPSEVLNTLKWSTTKEGADRIPDPKTLQPVDPFLGVRPLVVTKSIFDSTGFTKAHLRDVRPLYWRTFSGLVSRVREIVASEDRFAYLYYEGIDTTAHEFGFGDQFDTELAFVDFLIGGLIGVLPKRTALVITADHGQVQVDELPIRLSQDVLSQIHYQSGEGRFRWLHVKAGESEYVRDECRRLYGDLAVVLNRNEVIDAGIFGGDMKPEVSRRLGDIALIATKPVAFFDPTDTGPFDLVCRHGGLTSQEIEVPLLTLMP